MKKKQYLALSWLSEEERDLLDEDDPDDDLNLYKKNWINKKE